jgi:hypothetical protein
MCGVECGRWLCTGIRLTVGFIKKPRCEGRDFLIDGGLY